MTTLGRNVHVCPSNDLMEVSIKHSDERDGGRIRETSHR